MQIELAVDSGEDKICQRFNCLQTQQKISKSCNRNLSTSRVIINLVNSKKIRFSHWVAVAYAKNLFSLLFGTKKNLARIFRSATSRVMQDTGRDTGGGGRFLGGPFLKEILTGEQAVQPKFRSLGHGGGTLGGTRGQRPYWLYANRNK